MIYKSYNFNDTFMNASGTKRSVMVLGQLGKLINEHKDAVIGAIHDAGISISDNANRKEIIKKIIHNKRNTQLMMNLSSLIVLSSSFDGHYSAFFNLDETTDTTTGASNSTDEKGKIFAQIGSWFKAGKEKRQQKRAEAKAQGKPTFFDKVGNFFKKNKDNIGAVAGSLHGGLKNSKNANDVILQQQQQQQQALQEKEAKAKKMQTYYLIGAVVVILGFVAYKYYFKGKKA